MKQIIESCQSNMIFISHRNTDRKFADLLADFCVHIGISPTNIFCSSLPGNDVQRKIDVEVKTNLQNSCVNIILLSKDYYESTYCLNEEGIIWYLDVCASKPFLLFALPEINENNLMGFVDKNNIIRRLDGESDWMHAYDFLKKYYSLNLPSAKLNDVVKKTIKMSKELFDARVIPQEEIKLPCQLDFNNLTDDELIVLFYVLKKKKIQVSYDELNYWLLTSEIYEIDAMNAFNLLEKSNWGKQQNGNFEFEISFFRQLVSQHLDNQSNERIKEHYKLSSELLKLLWGQLKLTDVDKLFIAYIRNERVANFDPRWMKEQQIKDIIDWETKNNIDDVLSSNYGKALQFFIDHKFVYPSSYTSYGNPREYTLHASIKSYLFGNLFAYDDDIEQTKKRYPGIELPF